MKKSRDAATRVTRPGDQGRRSRGEREQWVSAYRSSGLTQEQYAQQAGLNLGTLRGWIYRKQPPAGGASHRSDFAPVRIVEEVRSRPAGGTVTVRWPQGVEVEIAVELDRGGAGRLVRELVQSCLR